ncbi:MAG: Eco57I restriction-modification methylase domain-containing protein [Promethearchaeota archaeon]
MEKPSLQNIISKAHKLIQKFEKQKFVEKDSIQTLGIIYTPKQVTDYIVANAFKIYIEGLINNEKLSRNKVDPEFLNRFLITNRELRKELIERIENIKVMDPACGSGRFLVSAANKLYEIYRILYSEKNEYDICREIIEKHLYGIEIEKSAYIISKLRLVLWLLSKNTNIINYNDINTKNLEPENLNQFISHFNLKFNIYNLDFLLEFNSNQFDIIIGNPPYIENKKLRNLEYKNKLIKEFKSAYRLFDISVLFIEKSFELLKQDTGCLAFLTINKFLSADYGVKIRNLLLNNTILKEIINISSVPIFESVATYPIIISFLKKKPSKDDLVSIKKFKCLKDLENNNPTYSNFLTQISIKDLPSYTFPISGNIGLLNFLYDKFKPINEVIDNLRIIYRPFGFLNWSKYLDDINEDKETDKDLLLIGTGNVGKYYINFDKHIKIAKKDFKISYFNFFPDFKNRWGILNSEKLIFREIAKDLTCVYDPGLYANVTGLYFLIIPTYSTDQLFCLLAILNSNAINLTFKSLFSSLHMAGGYLRFNGSFVRRLPLPKEFPLSLSYLGKIIQILSQLKYDLNSGNLESFKDSDINQFKEKKCKDLEINLEFYIKLANCFVNLLYFKDLYTNSNFKINLITDLLFSKKSIPNIQFKYLLPRFILPKFRVFQNQELVSTFSKIDNLYHELNQNDKLMNQIEDLKYDNIPSKSLKNSFYFKNI